MDDTIPSPNADRTPLQQIIGGLTKGVILVDPDQTIAWANAQALELHSVSDMAELGAAVFEFRERFVVTTTDTPWENGYVKSFNGTTLSVEWPPLDRTRGWLGLAADELTR